MLAGVQLSNVAVTQEANSELNIHGTATFNTGIGGNITLLNDDNIFTGNLLFTSARDVSLHDADLNGLILADTTIAGNLVLTSAGDVKFQNSDVVPLAKILRELQSASPIQGRLFPEI